jgi:hypothetical protein
MALVQLIIDHRGGEWVLLKTGIQVGEYATLAAAREVAEMIAQQIRLQDDDCEILVHDEGWSDEACPEGQGTSSAA